MRELFKNKEIIKKIFTYSVYGIIVVFAIYLFQNFSIVTDFFKELMNVLAPFIWGLIFAFILCRLADHIEKLLPEKMTFKTKRMMSTFISIIILMLVIVLIIMLIVPQLISSLASLYTQIISFANKAPEWLLELEEKFNISGDIFDEAYAYATDFLSTVLKALQTQLPAIISTAMSTLSNVLNFIIGFIVALYVLMDREHLLNIVKRTSKAILPHDVYAFIKHVCTLMVFNLYKFFEGKLLDSLIIGIICFIFMILFRMEYSLLVAVIIGLTNIIPFFGPFIGAVPSIFILLIISPLQALIFAVFILVLQQVDGNIIGPRIIGDSVGLSSLWIMFAIIVGGAYFGVAGMILGVPVFSVIYTLLRDFVNKRLEGDEEL